VGETRGKIPRALGFSSRCTGLAEVGSFSKIIPNRFSWTGTGPTMRLDAQCGVRSAPSRQEFGEDLDCCDKALKHRQFDSQHDIDLS
jgi:hypothetical protein